MTTKRLILMGSSIFQQWGTPSLPGITASNMAVDGTNTRFWLENARLNMVETVPNYAIYCGSNDLNQEVSPNDIVANTKAIFDVLKSVAWRTRIAYFAIMKAPQKSDKFAMIDDVNASIRSLLSDDDVFMDLNEIIDTSAKWYTGDNLHLRKEAYSEIEDKCARRLAEWVV